MRIRLGKPACEVVVATVCISTVLGLVGIGVYRARMAAERTSDL